MGKIIITIIVILLLLITATFLMQSSPETQSPIVVGEFPTSPFEESIEKSDMDSGVLQVTARSGQRVEVKGNFSAADVEKLSEDYFILFEATEPTEAARYDIYYDEVSGSILVALHEEPLSLAREEAVAALSQKLALPTASLCELEITIITNEYVNRQFTGYNLGIPGCPGAADLP